MNDIRMGFRHSMLQRFPNYNATTVKMSSPTAITSEQISTLQNVTDFSINRILGEKSNENIKTISNSKITASMVVKPTPLSANASVNNAGGILDLSKPTTSVDNAAFRDEPSERRPQYSTPIFHPDFVAATKFYAQFFPHMFTAAYAATVPQLPFPSGSTLASPTSFQKRFFAPYIVNSAASQNRDVPLKPSSGSRLPDESQSSPKSVSCTRTDCSGCLDYFKQYSSYKKTFSASPINPLIAAQSAHPHIKSSSPLLLNSAATISLTTVTNVNLTASKSMKLSTTLDTASSPNTPTEEISYKCRICDKVFGCSQTLQAHEKTHKSPRYECADCGKGFSQLRNYKYHLSVHRGTKEFAAECPECGKTFNDKGYLSSHMKIHRNKKEYECPYCPKSFNQRVAFNMHVRIHTGVKPHKCAECGKRFSRKMLLKQHLRTHSGEKPYQCSVCGKSFADRSNMTLHHRLHSGIKPFNCPICPKAFTKKHHLKTHLNYHTGCKPYVCPHPNCNQAFTQSSNMRTHAKKCQYRPLQLPTLPLSLPGKQAIPLKSGTTMSGSISAAAAPNVSTSNCSGIINNSNINVSSSNANLLASHFLPTSGHIANTPRRHINSTFTAGIRMLTSVASNGPAASPSSSSASVIASQSSTLPFPPTQQPLLSTLRPF